MNCYNKSMHSFAARFLTRWVANSLGLWLAAELLGGRISFGGDIGVILMAGLMLAFLNMFIKPLLVILSLPALILTLGLFLIVVNGLLVYLVSLLYPPLHITSFGAAVIAALIVGFTNWLVTTILEVKKNENEHL
jgi:putative membrane protein